MGKESTAALACHWPVQMSCQHECLATGEEISSSFAKSTVAVVADDARALALAARHRGSLIRDWTKGLSSWLSLSFSMVTVEMGPRGFGGSGCGMKSGSVGQKSVMAGRWVS